MVSYQTRLYAPAKALMSNPARPPLSLSGIVRFGAFEFDPASGELRRRGRLVTLQDQQSTVLRYLIEHAGVTVTREELRAVLWPDGTYVEFEFGLYNTVNRLRRALGDSASNPHFIQTEPKLGYRFIAALEHQPREEYPAPEPLIEPAHEPDQQQKKPNRLLIAGAIALFLLGALSGLWFAKRRSTPDTKSQMYRFAIEVPGVNRVPTLAISPSGDQIVFRGAKGLLYRRYLDHSDFRPVPASQQAMSPFFSPSGEGLGFFTGQDLKIVEGEQVRNLAALPIGYSFWNAFWAADGFVYFNTRQGDVDGIWRIPAKGGKISLVLASTSSSHGENRVFVNQVLTKPHHLLLYAATVGPTRRSLHVRDLERRSDTMVVEHGIGGRLMPDGHLVYYLRGSLYAVPFSAQSLSISGSPTEVVKDVADYFWQSGCASISDTGTLAYAPSPDPELRQLEWLDPSGKFTPLPVQADQYEQAEVSPRGDKLAIVRTEEAEHSSLWIYDLHTGAWQRIRDSHVPLLRAQWSPDETELVVSSERSNEDFANLYRVTLKNPENAIRITQEPDYGQFPEHWSAQANAILFMEGRHRETNGDILVLPLSGSESPKRLVATPGWDRSASFSSDGRFFLYESDNKIFIAPYDSKKAQPAGPAIQVSSDGGHDPAWSPDGRSIYYIDPSRQLVQTFLSKQNQPTSTRTLAKSIPWIQNMWTRAFSVAPDGRVLVISPLATPAKSAQIQVVVNWPTELMRLSPLGTRAW